jgi:hypothetical protein
MSDKVAKSRRTHLKNVEYKFTLSTSTSANSPDFPDTYDERVLKKERISIVCKQD